MTTICKWDLGKNIKTKDIKIQLSLVLALFKMWEQIHCITLIYNLMNLYECLTVHATIYKWDYSKNRVQIFKNPQGSSCNLEMLL